MGLCPKVQFDTVDEIDTFFREGRIHFNDDYIKKLVTLSAFYERVPVEEWPIHTPPEQQGFRFNRGFYDPCCPFRQIVADRCTQNSCDIEVTQVRRPGHETYVWGLGDRRFESEWFCIKDFMFRLFPLEEVTQFIDTLARITRSVGEEFARSYWVGGSQHKWMALVSDDGIDCDLLDDTSWFMEEHSGAGEMGYNPCYIRVKCDPDDLDSISMLTLDMLDEALIELQNEDDAYRLDLQEAAGMPLLDIIVPDVRMLNILWKQAKEENSNLDSTAGFDNRMTGLRLGIHRIISHYGFGYDIDGLRYNLDSTFEQPEYDESDATTWPRLVRAPRYVEAADELGYSYFPNPDYKNADFAIVNCHVQGAMTKWVRPSYTGEGQMQMADFAPNHMMEWVWRRPDWPENRFGELGFWQAQFMWGMQIKRPELMHNWLVRLPKRRRLKKECCTINRTYEPPAEIDNYVCQGLSVESSEEA